MHGGRLREERVFAFALSNPYPSDMGKFVQYAPASSLACAYLSHSLISITTQLWSEHNKQTWGLEEIITGDP